MADNPVIQTSMGLPKKKVDYVVKVAAEKNVQPAEIVSRAIGIEEYLRGVAKDGGTVLIKKKNSDKLEELVLDGD